MIQQILVGIIFLSALGFLTTLMIRSFRAKEGCASGCGKCGVDIAQVKVPTTPKP
ncbi:MAG: FeoB-associated Cys-rich membrane protein [Cyclobacteriaceae bacterium]|nr:FeoB-associated Cys-rich membrane protein [Cyclobacteriaceae bacterium]